MPSRNRWLSLAIVSCALLLITIDMTVLYTALPTLTRALQASASEKLWIVNAYALVMAALLPASGALGDKYGPKVMLLFGLLVFGTASMIAAFAPSSAILIGARVLLALGAAAMMPATLSIIRHSFEDERERSIAIGVWASVSAGGAAFGPVLGGLLLEHFWWGSVFLINVPIIVVAFLAGLIFISSNKSNHGQALDVIGSLQIMIGLIGVVLAIKEAAKQAPNWHLTLVALVVGASFIITFVRRQLKATAPMIDFSLFRNPSFTTAVVAALVSLAALIGLELVFSQRLQLVVGLTPLQAGFFILPIPLSAFIAGPIVGVIIPKFGARPVLGFGMLLAGLGIGLHLMTYDGSTALQIISFVMLGFGIGSAMTGASNAIMLNAPIERAGMAASIEEVSFELGGALGVAILGSVMSAAYSHSLSIPTNFSVPAKVYDSLDEALMIARSLEPAPAALLADLSRNAFNHSFLAVLSVAGAMLAIAALGIALFGGSRQT